MNLSIIYNRGLSSTGRDQDSGRFAAAKRHPEARLDLTLDTAAGQLTPEIWRAIGGLIKFSEKLGPYGKPIALVAVVVLLTGCVRPMTADVVPTAPYNLEPTDTPPPTLTSTASPTAATVLPTAAFTATPLAGIPDCRPLAGTADAMANDHQIDLRDGWNTIASAVNPQTVTCWLEQMLAARQAGILQPEHVTTFDKIYDITNADEANIAAEAASGDSDAELGNLIADWNANGLSDTVTAGKDLSRTMVKLSEKLADFGRDQAGTGWVNTPEAIFTNLTRGLGLEGKWKPGIDPAAVDEIKTCLTDRTDNGDQRLSQRHGVVKAHWSDLVEAPGGEFLNSAGTFELSNTDGLVITAAVVNKTQLTAIRERFKAKGWYLNESRIDNEHWAVVIVHDFDNQRPQKEEVFADPAARDIGSGDQLVPCGPGPVQAPEITATWVRTPSGPVLRATLTETPRPGATPGPTDTPRPPEPTQPTQPPQATETSQPTQPPPETPRPTDDPTQPPQDTATPGNPVETPNPPTPADTPIPPETPPGDTPVPPTPNTNETPLAP